MTFSFLRSGQWIGFVLTVFLALSLPDGAFTQEAGSDERHPQIDPRRDQLQENLMAFWKNGNVRAAREIGQQLLTIETELYGSHDDRVAVRHQRQCEFSLELQEDQAARQHFESYFQIYQTQQAEKSWQRTEATRERDLLEKFLALPIDERQQLFDLRRQVLQELGENRLDRALKAAEGSARVARDLVGERHPFCIMEMLNIQYIQVQRGDLTNVGKQLIRLHNILMQVEHPDHPNFGVLLLVLADYHQRVGEHERALQTFGESIEQFKKSGSTFRQEFCLALALQGGLLCGNGEFQDALAPLREAFHISTQEALPGEIRKNVIVNSLCYALQESARREQTGNDWKQAMKLLEEAWPLSVEYFGEDHTRSVDLKFELDFIRTAADWTPDQLQNYRQLDNLRSTIIAHVQAGESPQALALARKRHESLAALRGATSSEALRARFDVLSLLLTLPDEQPERQPDGSSNLHKQLEEFLTEFENCFGTSHVECGNISFSFAQALDPDDPSAVAFARKSAESFKASLTSSSSEYVQSLTLLGTLLARDNVPEAVDVLEEAITLWNAGGARGSMGHCDALLALGSYHYEVGNPYDARLLLPQAVDLLRTKPAADRGLDLAVALNYLGNIASDRAAYDDAIKYYREAVHLFESTPWRPADRHHYGSPGAYTSFYQWTLYNSGNSHFYMKNYEQAERLLLKLLDRFPDASPLDAYRSACYSLANVYEKQQRFAEAGKILDRADASVQVHAADDPLVSGELLLEQTELAFAAGDDARFRLKYDSCWTTFQKIKSPDAVPVDEGDYFLKYMGRLITLCEQVDDWDRVVEVRRFLRPFDDVILDGWPSMLADAKAELALAERVAGLDVETRQHVRQMRLWTEQLQQHSDDNFAGLDESILEQTQPLLVKVNDVLGEHNLVAARFCEALAACYEFRQEYGKAFTLLSDSLISNTALLGAEHSTPAITALQIGRITRQLGEYQKARQFDEYAIELLKHALGQHSIEIMHAEMELARLHTDLQDYAAAMPLARHAVEGYRRLWGEQNAGYAQGLELLGKISAGLHEPELARTYFQQAHSILTELLESEDRRLLRSHANQAVAAAWNPQRADAAQKLFDDVIAKYQAADLEHLVEYTELLVNYGDALLEWGKFAEAEQVFLRARGSRVKLDWLAEAVIQQELLTRLGQAQRRLGKLDEAIDHLSEAVRIQRNLYGDASRILSETLFQLSIAEQQQGRRDDARAHVLESLQIQQRIIGQVGNLMSDESLSLMLNSEEGQLDLLLSLLLQSSPSSEELSEAFRWTFQRKGISLDLSCRRRSLQQSEVYDTQTVERVEQLRLLNQQVADFALRSPPGLSPEEVTQAREELNRKIGEANSELALTLQSAGIFLPEVDGNATAVSRKLSAGTVFIEYVRMNQIAPLDSEPPAVPRYVAFVLAGGSSEAEIRFADLGNADEIDELIEKMRDQTRQVPRMLRISGEDDLEKKYMNTAQDLYDRLLAPFSDQLQHADTIVIGPDAALCKVPFAALVDSEQRYVIETADISYVSSSRDFLRSHGPPGQGVIILSNPNFDADLESRQQVLREVETREPGLSLLALRESREIDLRSLRWRRLPGAEQEAQDVNELLGQSNFAPVKIYLGEAAVEEVLKTAQSPRVVHLATHGFYVPLEAENLDKESDLRSFSSGTSLSRLRTDRNPLLRSGIVLAGANRLASGEDAAGTLEDGWVTAQEIASMDFRNTELVVLSACESGLGDIATGQGVQGIRRAFLNAGGHSVLTSLYEVPDGETRQLMHGFYQELLETDNRRAALSRAQRQRIVERRQAEGAAHPFFWASFILLGTAE